MDIGTGTCGSVEVVAVNVASAMVMRTSGIIKGDLIDVFKSKP